MKILAFCAALLLCSVSGLHAADLVSGTWTSGDGTAVRVYVFKVSGDRLDRHCVRTLRQSGQRVQNRGRPDAE